jgi:hypothetical protein
MEDWATFSVTLLPLVMTADGVPQCVRELCAPLHHVATFFLRYRDGQTSQGNVRAAAKAALDFAAMVEKAFRRHVLATHQLHVVAVHLALLSKQWGPVCFLCEYWIERLMQVSTATCRQENPITSSCVCVCVCGGGRLIKTEPEQRRVCVGV